MTGNRPIKRKKKKVSLQKINGRSNFRNLRESAAIILNSLQERYLNFLPGDKAEKEKYAQEVFDLLTKAYAYIGGIHGSGFKSPEDMIANIPMWKLARKDSRIVAGIMYKDKQGRKLVAAFTDGTDLGKNALADMYKDDLGRAYKETSSKALSFAKKIMGKDKILHYAVPYDKVISLLHDDEIFPVKDDDEEIQRHPELKKFFYARKIGGQLHTKIMLGTTGKVITE